MLLQSVQDPRLSDVVLRIVQNAYTSTITITARTIGVGQPVIAETATGSLPTTNYLPLTSATVQNYARRPATSTSLVNNLFLGILAKTPGTAGYIDSDQIGLVQCYGAYVGAQVQVKTDSSLVGMAMIPTDLGFMMHSGGPVTGTATGTDGNTETPAIGCLAVNMQIVNASSVTITSTSILHLRCM
jgi:hypothetical protein